MTPVELPYVPILLNETFITALWDTGAEKSFISEEVYRNYFHTEKKDERQSRDSTRSPVQSFGVMYYSTCGKILGGPTGVFGAKKRQIEGFQKGINDEKPLGSICVSEGRRGDEMGEEQRLVSESGGGYEKLQNHEMNGDS
ncbi:hypothetical protein TNCV_1754491 [Trichonephila clavipes]|nr:hypothetical protein TNCV_1754491 [Trichonephila clavipes]